MKIYAAVVKALGQMERGDETQFTTKIAGKTSLGPSYKILFPVKHLMPCYAEIGRSRPLITQLYS